MAYFCTNSTYITLSEGLNLQSLCLIEQLSIAFGVEAQEDWLAVPSDLFLKVVSPFFDYLAEKQLKKELVFLPDYWTVLCSSSELSWLPSVEMLLKEDLEAEEY